MDLAEFPAHFLATFPEVVGERVLVALSGGPDSVALLHLLDHPDLELELEAVHVHHGTRGAEADGDAAFCEELCLKLNIPFHLRFGTWPFSNSWRSRRRPLWPPATTSTMLPRVCWCS